MPLPSTRLPSVHARLVAPGILLAACTALGSSMAAESRDWSVIGRQGIVELVLVPTEQAADRQAYDQQIDRLCKPRQTCFLNFYTNTTAIAVAVPLPDPIASEATATFRRSVKQGAELFMWSCRMKVASGECF